jgi:hypothetical protein
MKSIAKMMGKSLFPPPTKKIMTNNIVLQEIHSRCKLPFRQEIIESRGLSVSLKYKTLKVNH